MRIKLTRATTIHGDVELGPGDSIDPNGFHLEITGTLTSTRRGHPATSKGVIITSRKPLERVRMTKTKRRG